MAISARLKEGEEVRLGMEGNWDQRDAGKVRQTTRSRHGTRIRETGVP